MARWFTSRRTDPPARARLGDLRGASGTSSRPVSLRALSRWRISGDHTFTADQVHECACFSRDDPRGVRGGLRRRGVDAPSGRSRRAAVGLQPYLPPPPAVVAPDLPPSSSLLEPLLPPPSSAVAPAFSTLGRVDNRLVHSGRGETLLGSMLTPAGTSSRALVPPHALEDVGMASRTFTPFPGFPSDCPHDLDQVCPSSSPPARVPMW